MFPTINTEELASCRNSLELGSRLERLGHELGYQTYAVGAVRDLPDGTSQFSSIDNVPEAYRATYTDPARGKVDPVMQHIKQSSVPIIWDQENYIEAGAITKWEEQAAFGFQTGVIGALHLPNNLHVFLGFDKPGHKPTNPAETQAVLASLSLAMLSVTESALKLLDDARLLTAPACVLDAREIDILTWVSKGKTRYEIGRILGMTERNIKRISEKTRAKLGCSDTRQAAYKAHNLGLLG